MAATIYMMFGRLARVLHAEEHSIVRVSLLTKLFVGGDVLSFVVQGGSAGLLMKENLASIGKAMVIVGLVRERMVQAHLAVQLQTPGWSLKRQREQHRL